MRQIFVLKHGHLIFNFHLTAREEHIPVVTSGGQSSCDENQFTCSEEGSQCISNDLLCNGESDCDNGADESSETCGNNQNAAG